MMKDKSILKELNKRINQKQKVLEEVGQQIGERRGELLDYETSLNKQIADKLTENKSIELVYSYPDNVPDYAKNLPAGAQRLCIAAFNATIEGGGDEEEARMACWGAVKNKYEQTANGLWIIKATEGTMIDLDDLDTLGKLYASHNRVHAEYIDARHGPRRKTQMQDDHEAVVRKIKDLGGKHIPHGEVLDDTLPDDLKGAVKLRYMSNSLLLEEIDGAQISKIQVLRTGTFYHSAYGKFTITQDTLDSMVNNFSSNRPKAPTEMVVDWEHMSVAEPPVVAPAAGWVRSVFSEDGKLFATVEWTKEAAEQIENKQYRFISPEIDLNYKDKETNKGIGPTLMAIALTNRPFIEGMEPVVLSDELTSMIFAEESFYEQEDVVRSAYYAQFGSPNGVGGPYVRDIYEDYAIIEEGGKMYKLPYTRGETDIVFDTANKVEVQRIVNYIGLTETMQKGGQIMDARQEQELRTLFGMAADDDVTALITLFKAKADEDADKFTELQAALAAANTKADEAQVKLDGADAEKLVSKALSDGKITPKMREWALKEALTNSEAFTAFIEVAEKVGPGLDIKGKEDTGDSTKLTEMEIAVAKKLGVSEENMLKAKEAIETKKE